MSSKNTTIAQTETSLTFTRLFDAPRELVFEMFSKPEHLTEWWGPKAWKVSDCTVDFRPGGAWRYCLRGDNRQVIWVEARYQEIVVPERIVYSDGFVDPEGNPTEELARGITTVTFEEQQGKTKITSRVEYETTGDVERAKAQGMVEGVGESWDLLAQRLADHRAISHPEKRAGA